MSSIRPSTFLRRVLWLDAASCAGMGVLLATASGLLSGLLNLPAGLLRESAMVLLAFAALLAFLATRTHLARGAVWTVIVVNAIWVIDSIVLLFTGWVQPNLFGHVFVVGQAAVVAALAELEYLGLRKSASVVVADA
jgi:hypothetical protein